MLPFEKAEFKLAWTPKREHWFTWVESTGVVMYSGITISGNSCCQHDISWLWFFFILRTGFVVVQSISRVWLFVTPWTAAPQAPLSSTISQSSPKFMSMESVMLSNHLILCCSLLFLLSIFPTIRIFFKTLELTLFTHNSNGPLPCNGHLIFWDYILDFINDKERETIFLQRPAINSQERILIAQDWISC